MFPLQVQAGVARTGKWWGHQHVSAEAVEPDIMIFAKGIASGFPFAGEAMLEVLTATDHNAADWLCHLSTSEAMTERRHAGE